MTKLVLTQGLIAGVCAASLSAATASSDPGVPFHDLLIGVAIAPVPKVSETTTATDGSSLGYDWKDQNSSGQQITITSLNGVGHKWGGIVWGLEAALGFYNITPSTYDVIGGSPARNRSDNTLNYRTIGGNVLLGYEYGIAKADGMQAFVEILPYVGGGFGLAESEVYYSAQKNYDKQSGVGRYTNYGIKVGGFLVDSRWVYGVLAGYGRSSGKATIDFSGYQSELTLKGAGLVAEFQVGYRF